MKFVSTMRLMLCALLSLFNVGCKSDNQLVTGVYLNRIEHDVFQDYSISIHSRLRLTSDSYSEVRSYRVKFDDDRKDVDLGVVYFGGEKSQSNQDIIVSLDHVSINISVELYKKYISVPQPELARLDLGLHVKNKNMLFSIVQYDEGGLCLIRNAKVPQCFILTQPA